MWTQKDGKVEPSLRNTGVFLYSLYQAATPFCLMSSARLDHKHEGLSLRGELILHLLYIWKRLLFLMPSLACL